MKKFHSNFNKLFCMLFVNKRTSQKEIHLKNLIVKLLEEKNLKDFDTIDQLFAELKRDLKTQ